MYILGDKDIKCFGFWCHHMHCLKYKTVIFVLMAVGIYMDSV